MNKNKINAYYLAGIGKKYNVISVAFEIIIYTLSTNHSSRMYNQEPLSARS